MKINKRETENELIRIFKYFSGGVALVFVLLLLAPGPLSSKDPASRRSMLQFCITYGVIFFYLMIPGLDRRMKAWYLPPVLIAASLIPIAIINAKYRLLLASGSTINTLDDTMTVTVLLIFPLIITAWKYSFPIVFLFYVVLGFLDPLLIILVNESFTPEVYGAFNASLVRILALGAVGFMITELRDRQRLEQRELEEANRKLEDYARASERLAASRERNRLARDMHDTLAHTLSGLAIQLEATETVVDPGNERLVKMIVTARETVRNGLKETRRALKAMRASPLEDMGLLLALQRLADDASNRDSIIVNTTLPEENPDIEENVEEVVYRIAQEALENIVRHANASEAELKVTGDKDRLVLTVHDDGLGFDSSRIQEDGRFGLRGMQERAHAVGGNLSIISKPGNGTTITFAWSVKP